MSPEAMYAMSRSNRSENGALAGDAATDAHVTQWQRQPPPFKVSLKYDNPQARQVHKFPNDPLQVETKDEAKEIMGTGNSR